jgi:hypothetical protein
MVAKPFCRAQSRESAGHLSCMSCSIRLSCDSYHRPIVRFARKVVGRPRGVARNKPQYAHWSQREAQSDVGGGEGGVSERSEVPYRRQDRHTSATGR